MPIGVGQRAGVQHDVPRGHIRIDRAHATAWVNDDDWCALEGSDQGIAGILGGADNDDALWTHPFQDHDGEAKVLVWRSPNQTGEYLVLKPTLGSYTLDWPTVSGTVQYPPADSRALPPRIDTRPTDYLNLIDPQSAGGLGEGQPYSIDAMDLTLARARANAGALGMYCNTLMVSKAVYGGLPRHPPAPLEQVIDGSVKTGVDLSPVTRWCQNASSRLLHQGKPVPKILHNRLVMNKDLPPLVLSQDHWLDRLVQGVQVHITAFEAQRDSLAAQAMPPRRMFDYVFSREPDLIPIGAKLSSTYGATMKRKLRASGRLTAEDYETARASAEAFLADYPPEQQPGILRGAMVAAYLSDKPVDTAIWLPGEKTDSGRAPGIAQMSLRALREIGVLDEVGVSGGQVLVYPGAVIREPAYQTIGINAVWFHWYRAWQLSQGQSLAAEMRDVPKAQATWAKRQVQQLTQSAFRQLPIHIRTEGDRKMAYTTDGQRLGVISRDSQAALAEGQARLAYSLAHDGNLRAVIWPPDTASADGTEEGADAPDLGEIGFGSADRAQ
jgi:hypothetical protein